MNPINYPSLPLDVTFVFLHPLPPFPPRKTTSTTTNTQTQPPVPSSTPPPRPGRLRWGVGSGNTSPTKRSNFWLAKTMLGANKGNKYRHEGECPASAPVTPTNNRKGAWWRKSRAVLTSPPSSMWGKAGTTTASVATDGYGYGNGNANGRAEEGQAQDGGGCTVNKRSASTWVKLRRRWSGVRSTIISCNITMCVCVRVCLFIKLHITAQSGLVILVILCHSH